MERHGATGFCYCRGGVHRGSFELLCVRYCALGGTCPYPAACEHFTQVDVVSVVCATLQFGAWRGLQFRQSMPVEFLSLHDTALAV